MTITIVRRVGQELPSIPLDWMEYDATTDADIVADLATGWTGTAQITSPDAPNTLLHTATGVTLADASPNYVITFTDTDDTTLLTAWGKPLPERGAPFIIDPTLEDGSGNDRGPWPGPQIVMWLKPAIA